MMKKKKDTVLSICFIVFSFISIQLFAQVSDENTLAISNYFQSVNTIATEINIQKIDNSNIQLTPSAKTELNILQVGNSNLIHINSSENNINATQIGDKNSYEFLTYYGRDDLNMDVQQIGEGNAVQIFGENSLMNNIKIVQKSNNKTITINNYN
ncbi:hypothetical protein R3X25_09975 [Lutibacter sp. TH_r2]|uniref:hypothetical protein n=1 Tax=Lutibacter sp. TH_r2 TaxID=3082083 RepID=UPI00295492A1|nr:hypothetical protein [Lutibacter sp. TH_r2]MDV7187608.1 hypothetical protein [Lutibacter sp. TH_r2]